jgi:hypothetical protein
MVLFVSVPTNRQKNDETDRVKVISCRFFFYRQKNHNFPVCVGCTNRKIEFKSAGLESHGLTWAWAALAFQPAQRQAGCGRGHINAPRPNPSPSLKLGSSRPLLASLSSGGAHIQLRAAAPSRPLPLGPTRRHGLRRRRAPRAAAWPQDSRSLAGRIQGGGSHHGLRHRPAPLAATHPCPKLQPPAPPPPRRCARG